MTGFLHVLPDFYIIGTQKGGTSSLYEYLVGHPSIQPCYSKEPSYFDRYFERGLNWYKVYIPFIIHRFITTKIFSYRVPVCISFFNNLWLSSTKKTYFFPSSVKTDVTGIVNTSVSFFSGSIAVASIPERASSEVTRTLTACVNVLISGSVW